MALTRLNNRSVTAVTSLPAAALSGTPFPAGHVVQVVHSENNTVQSFAIGPTATTSAPLASTLSVSITPTYANSKIMILARCQVSTNSQFGGTYLMFYRNNSVQLNGATGGTYNFPSGFWNCYTLANTGNYDSTPVMMTYYDSPATTSTVSYTVYVAGVPGTGNLYMNRGGDNSSHYTSTITAMEIKQ